MPMTGTPIQDFQDHIGHSFSKLRLLEKALTHSSAGTGINYERLEFLGDRVVGLVMAEWLFEEFPKEKEGDMARRHAALVQGRMLAVIAREINLGDIMIFSEAEAAAGGADNENILADGMEAVIGALFVDAGYETCRTILRALWGDRIHIMKKPPKDPKTALQEWAQARGLPLPTYDLVRRDGPDHAPVFEIAVTVQGYPSWSTTGSSRRKAEKDAAGMLLAHLVEMEGP